MLCVTLELAFETAIDTLKKRTKSNGERAAERQDAQNRRGDKGERRPSGSSAYRRGVYPARTVVRRGARELLPPLPGPDGRRVRSAQRCGSRGASGSAERHGGDGGRGSKASTDHARPPAGRADRLHVSVSRAEGLRHRDRAVRGQPPGARTGLSSQTSSSSHQSGETSTRAS